MISLQNNLVQQQTVTTQLVQDMSILQMSATELEEYLEKLSLENPVIELVEKEAGPSSRQMEFQRKQNWLASTDRQNRVYYDNDGDDEHLDNLWRDEGPEEDLTGYLWSQLLLADYDRQDREIIDYLIRSLDSGGYCREDLEKLAVSQGVSRAHVEELLRDIQALDPAGIGARSLEECLLLQLERCRSDNELTKRIVRDHLQDVAKNHLQAIAKELNVSVKDVTACCDEIRTLNPKPGSCFHSGEQLRYITPDALVVRDGEGFEIIVNENQYPEFEISAYYRHLEQTTEDQEAKDYLREKIRQASRLSDSIAMRTRNLRRMLNFLVERQEAFFRLGPGHKAPMKLADIAMELQMHESTVSRTLRSKYLQCSWGVYPLSYFLTGVASVSASDGSQQTQERIKQKLTEIIQAEDKRKPLSDEAIRKLLQERYRIDISRRTVNKYRAEMNIPDKIGRKDWNA